MLIVIVAHSLVRASTVAAGWELNYWVVGLLAYRSLVGLVSDRDYLENPAVAPDVPRKRCKHDTVLPAEI